MIHYSHNISIEPKLFIDVLERSGLRRPTHDVPRITAMLKHANLIVTAWDDVQLVGVSRALTDFSYCCYLSDLAVDKMYHKQGIGRRLVEETHHQAGAHTSLILLSVPDAMSYYSHIGMEKIENGFVIKRIG